MFTKSFCNARRVLWASNKFNNTTKIFHTKGGEGEEDAVSNRNYKQHHELDAGTTSDINSI